MLKFKRDDWTGHGGYVATLPNGNYYRVFKVDKCLLGRYGGGTIYTFWRADYVEVNPDAKCPWQRETSHKLLIGKKYAPDHFRSDTSDTKKLAVHACEAHANGADNVVKR